jgi:hypothetical protein
VQPLRVAVIGGGEHGGGLACLDPLAHLARGPETRRDLDPGRGGVGFGDLA